MVDKVMFSSASVEWGTPQALFDKLNEEFHFTLDPAATKANAKCNKFYTKKENGLLQSWEGEKVFCNPPYGRGIKDPRNSKAVGSKAHVAVLLIPARTDTKWFQDWVLPYANEIRFVRGRVNFVGTKKSGNTFPSVIAIFYQNDRVRLEASSWIWRNH